MSDLSWTSEFVPLGALIEYEKNPVQISKRDARELAKSLKKFGHIIPYTAAAPKNGADVPILDGHQRKKVEIELLGVDPETMVEVRFPSRVLTDKERQEAIIRLRKNTGEFDPDALLNWFESDDLLDWGFDEKELEKIGFEFGGGRDAEPEIDRAAELLEKWGVQPGDLWLIGEHRLICGDCTDAATVARVMDGEKAGACVTDSPYGINREGIENDDPEGLRELFDGCLSCMPIENGVIINFQSTRLFPVWLDAVRAAGHKFERSLWYAETGSQNVYPWHGWMMRGQILSVSTVGKPVWAESPEVVRDTYSVNFLVQDIGEVGKMHTTIKPIEVIQSLVDHTAGDVYEPFSGSGTTLVACENLRRKCRAIEISPAYVAVALERMSQAFEGIEIVRLS